ncbi:polyamine aminopropyltransferase [Ditylenchus destructor]|uniref:Polyamine aminopropyltransferase n=1 Tax=Ditylenchus destructor TaxID=166010 RepID=A0AAD4N0L0_9BILA|nr:polyamine aminopropyltransferase [Ditylenchus destructor]
MITVKNGISWKFALVFICGLVITAQLILILAWRFKLFGNKFGKYERWVNVVEPNSDMYSQLMASPDEIIQEIACTRLEAQCYYVVDGASKYGSGYGRSLLVEPLYNMIISEVDLRNANYEPLTKGNARGWPVKVGHLTVDYQKVLAVQPFITGTFNMDFESLKSQNIVTNSSTEIEEVTLPTPIQNPQPLRVLLFGLGAATINNFYSANFPQHKIRVVEPEPTLKYLAEKFFAYNETDNHKVIVKEPLSFLYERSAKYREKAKKFDVVFIDYCYKTREKHAQCPTSEFADPETIALLKEHLSDNGTIVINVFSLARKFETSKQHELANYEHNLLLLYRGYFGSCYYVHISNNMILTCSSEKQLPERMTQKHYTNAFKSAKLPQEMDIFTDLEGPKGKSVAQSLQNISTSSTVMKFYLLLGVTLLAFVVLAQASQPRLSSVEEDDMEIIRERRTPQMMNNRMMRPPIMPRPMMASRMQKRQKRQYNPIPHNYGIPPLPGK